jgi:hypothetical protein
MPRPLHLILPFAHAVGFDAARTTLANDLPMLRRLLARLRPGPLQTGDALNLSPPHERVHAQALGLTATDGRLAWAAWELAQTGHPPGDAAWAWITPCHWHVARDHILMHPIDQLQLDEADSRALLAAIAPYFEQDNIALTYVTPTRWLARGEIFRALACASLDRVEGRRVDDWLPRAAHARTVRRLQQEMQMLLYTHAVNEARERVCLQPVNSFWVSGAGALTPVVGGAPTHLRIDDRLRGPALRAHEQDWVQAWRAIDAQALPPLLEALAQGHAVTLTLCGERNARSWAAPPAPPWWQRAARLLRPPSVAAVLEDL